MTPNLSPGAKAIKTLSRFGMSSFSYCDSVHEYQVHVLCLEKALLFFLSVVTCIILFHFNGCELVALTVGDCRPRDYLRLFVLAAKTDCVA